MNYKSLNEIIHSIINNVHDKLPEADTKEGTFIRDVFINPISNEFAGLYGDLKLMKLSQSILTATGKDLDKLAANYFVERKSATKSYGKLRFYIVGTNDLTNTTIPEEIVIPEGTIVSTVGTYTKEPIKVRTNETIKLNKSRILTLPQDLNYSGFRYIEVQATSVNYGAENNIGSMQLVRQETNITQDILSVTNPFAFSGGTDTEDDNSLLLRIRLAISGSNIGTKDGYLGYVLRHNGVVDAKVIGAEDEIMVRDEGYGGCVDIYIRGILNEESVQDFVIDYDYIGDYQDIILEKQPVNSIVYLEADDGTKFINAADFEVTKETTVQDNGETAVNPTFYKNYEWDFSIVDRFIETEKFKLPDYLTSFQIKKLKADVDLELRSALIYMTNINPDLNWNTMTKIRDSDIFSMWGSNNKIYRIIATHPWLNGVMFIKKNDKIYLRERGEPDFMLIKDNGLLCNSTKAVDRIKWIEEGKNKPMVGQTLSIKYNFDKLINDLQDGIEANRILTADVLIKRATRVDIQIELDAIAYSSYNISEIKKEIINNISTYINNIKKMGSEFDRSDIVALAKSVEGVDMIHLESVKINKIGLSPEEIIKTKENEYLNLNTIIVNVKPSNNIV